MDGDALDKLDAAAERLERVASALPTSRATGNHSTISINAGGVGVWIATTCCIVMLAVIGIGGLWMDREFQRHDAQLAELRQDNADLHEYLAAIYMIAPSLKPEPKKGEDNGHRR